MEWTFERTVDELGRILLPKDLRKGLELTAGTRVIISLTEEGFFIKKIKE